ncbi:hypothetical protein BD414DRAFT_135592 [Trametes punicea]|nr:hypothetical protein BD414DRAFT_135592 [Trametes punicea]
MIANHPLLSPELCGLPDIHTVRAPFFVALTKVLEESVPAFADQRLCTPGTKPAKLLVIDTFTDVFDHAQDERYSDTTLRARDLKQVSLTLHRLASKYQLAVIILGGVRDTFPRVDGGDRAPGELRYSDQERWFARAHTLPGEDAHEAILGHVWPNQLNARIMMSRTIRTRPRSMVHPRAHVCEGGSGPKRRKLEGEQQRVATPAPDEPVPFRRFSVIFSSVGPPAFCDYVIFDEGVTGIPPEEQPPSTFLYPTPPSSSPIPSSDSSGLALESTVPFGSDSQQPPYLQSLSYASLSNPRTPLIPPSQSVVPSSQPDLDEDWNMYWKDTQDDDQLFASVGEQVEDGEPEEAAAAGPPVENDTDSDYYWDNGNDDDALYADL